MRIVHCPHFVRTGRKREWHPRFGSKSLAPPTLHRQPFLPVQPIHSLVVDPPPKRSVLGLLPSQENVQPPIAESWTLGCQLAQPSPQRRFVPFPSLVPPAPTVHPDQPTGASLTEPCFLSHDTHRFSFCPRAYLFFASTTFSASRSSACCATIFFSRPFSSSRLTQPPGLVHFQTPILRLPVVERGVANPPSAAEVLHGDPGLRFFQHPDDLLFTKAAPFHGASPLVVLYPEKLSFGWTKFRGAGQRLRIHSRVVANLESRPHEVH